MMRRVRFAIAAWLVAPVAALAAEPVDYLITPEVVAGRLERIVIELRFQGDSDGETRIDLPDRWAGSDRLYDAVEELKVKGGTLGPGEGPAHRTVTHAPDAPLVLTYSIGPSAADPDAGYEKARPVVRPDWFYIHGEGAIVAPGGRGEAPARLSWAAPTLGWKWASSADETGDGLTVDGIAGSILVGGTDLRIHERPVGGKPVKLVMRGEWPFADEALADGLARAVAAENAYLGAKAAPYMVSLIPLTGSENGAISYGGSGRTGGFALSSTTNVGLAKMLPTLAHEYGHRWFGGEFGPTATPEGSGYWFTEGFNDFAAYQSLVRGGVWSAEDYAAALNDVLLRYASSSARAKGNALLAEEFWTDSDAQQMLYDRGHLFALRLDEAPGQVRTALAEMAQRSASFSEQTQGERFVRAYGVAGPPMTAMLSGEPIELPADLLAPCGEIGWKEQPIYATGYTVEERPDGRFFKTVEEGSSAWAAGLRPGMRYVRRVSFKPGDSTVPMVMRVADDAGERVLTWLPQGREIVRFQHLTLRGAGNETERNACRSRFGGGMAKP